MQFGEAIANLHSTMYLLNHRGGYLNDKVYLKFTFHYVSIKSGIFQFRLWLFSNLHSTMYLLNRLPAMDIPRLAAHLHSTMYLLNLSW